MEIGFRGLIAFVKLDKTNPHRYVAALMKHGPHQAVLSVPKGKFLAAESSLGGKPNKDGTLMCFDLSGRVLTSLGLGVPNDANLGKVPRTLEGFPEGKTLEGTLKVGTPALFSAVFEFPAGDLAVNTYFDFKGSFDGKTYKCIPKTVLFSSMSSADPVTFYVGSVANTVVVEGDALVAITNLDPAAGGGHYHAFEKLFKESITKIQTPKSDPDQPCPDKGTEKPVLSCTTTVQDPDVDCSPVRFP